MLLWELWRNIDVPGVIVFGEFVPVRLESLLSKSSLLYYD